MFHLPIYNIWECAKNWQNLWIKVNMWAPTSEFVSSSIPSWQISNAHAEPFRGARDLAFCLKVPLDSLLVWASSEGSGETARMRRLTWTIAARIGDKYQIRLTRSMWTLRCSSDHWKLQMFKRRNTGRHWAQRGVVCRKYNYAMSEGSIYTEWQSWWKFKTAPYTYS